jgi:ABC-type dipeptide/oligopeptide/nickel transport system permease component
MGGDPAVNILGNRATEQSLQAMRERLGLNKPLLEQYVSMLKDLMHFDLGRDLFSDEPIVELFKKPITYTLNLAISATIIGSLIGIPLGILAAVYWRTTIDSLSRIASLIGFSFPIFYVGIVLLYVFALTLRWFPLMGGGDFYDIPDRLYHLFLPAMTLGVVKAAFVTRLTRSAMLNCIRADYITTARSKGLRERVVLYKHALRNALIPVITMIAAYMTFTIGGSIVVEIVFSRPGIGKFLIGAIHERNYPVIQSGLIIFSMMVVITNLIVDLLYSLIDPRITYD